MNQKCIARLHWQLAFCSTAHWFSLTSSTLEHGLRSQHALDQILTISLWIELWIGLTPDPAHAAHPKGSRPCMQAQTSFGEGDAGCCCFCWQVEGGCCLACLTELTLQDPLGRVGNLYKLLRQVHTWGRVRRGGGKVGREGKGSQAGGYELSGGWKA